MSSYINAVCPKCGAEHENVSDEFVGVKMACLNCNNEFIVANVEVSGTDFTDDGVNACCPHCGVINLAPMTSIEHNVRCYACGAKFHISRKRRQVVSIIQAKPQQSTQNIPPATVAPTVGSKRKKILLIGCLVLLGLALFVMKLPALIFAFKEHTGIGAALVEICYDDDSCYVEYNRALAIEDYSNAIKWAKRMRVPERRQIALQRIESMRKFNKMAKEVWY